jgi:PAS domain S-box-containing protein
MRKNCKYLQEDLNSYKKTIEEKLRESEEKYRNIIETANEGIYTVDAETKITYVNSNLMKMLGYSLEECICRPMWDFICEDDRFIVKLNLEKRRKGIDEVNEFKIKRKDGSYLWTLVSAKPLFDKDGKFMGAVCMLTDISSRKEAEQTLANFEVAREKEIHHRIKNNLQVVSSLLDFHAFKFKGRNDIKDSEVIDSFKESKNRVQSMALIHEELYKGSGLETINFSAYVEKLVNNLLSLYRLGKLDVSLNKDMEEDLFFDMDTAIPLGTMINEIVSNSLKHAFRGRDKGEIQIKIHREEENRECIKGITENSKSTTFVLTVSDNGVGIPENLDIEELDSLGLQLVTTLVNKSGGELELKSNNGTEFIIRFTVTEKDKQVPAAAVLQSIE